MLACIYGNGLLAIILSIIAAQHMFIRPYISLDFVWPHDFIRLLVFFVSSWSVQILVKKLIDARAQAYRVVTSLKEEKVLREMFVSTLSHDLQTPLTTIKMSTHLLMKHPERINEKYFERVLNNSTRIEQMVRNLLDSNQITAGKVLPVQIEELELCSTIIKTIDELKLIYGDRFVFKGPESIIGQWSRDAIQRIIENLCSNAVKYGAAETPITIRVSTFSNFLEISIHNSGNAIPNDEQPTLFDPFERSKSARESTIKGWGLGLALVKGLTEAMNGTVVVLSNSKQGTTFTITLPWQNKVVTNQNSDPSSQLTL